MINAIIPVMITQTFKLRLTMLVSEESCVDGLRLIFHILLLVCFGLVEEVETLAGE